MSNKIYIKDFPGDGESGIELHHGEAARWTKRMTIISVVIIVLAIEASMIAIMAIQISQY